MSGIFNKIPLLGRISGSLVRSVAPDGAGGTNSTTTPSSSSSSSSGGGGGSSGNLPEGAQKCIIAAGCFWGVEHIYLKHFSRSQILSTSVGYIGGQVSSPTYRGVCSGSTGHAEACLLVFDPEKVSYASLLEFFYKTHDPTTPNAQGADAGSQYRSAIFWSAPEQEKVARQVTERANRQWWDGRIVTEIVQAGEWWNAEDYHQEYLHKNPYGYQCPTHHVRKLPDLKYD